MTKQEVREYLEQGFDTIWTINPTTLKPSPVSVPVVKANFEFEYISSRFKNLDVDISFEDLFVSEAAVRDYLNRIL